MPHHRDHDHRDYEPSPERYRGHGPYGERSRGGWTGGDYIGPTMSYGGELVRRGGGYNEMSGRYHDEPQYYRAGRARGRFATWPEEVAPGPHRGVGPRGYRRSDERILEQVCDILTDHPNIDASEISVQVKDAEVILDGFIADRRMKRWAEDVVCDVPGVHDVINRLRVHRREIVGKSHETHRAPTASR